MTSAIGLAMLSAAAPAKIRTRRISSVAYATDESASDDSTASPMILEQPFVMGEVGGDRLADDEPLDLVEEAFFRHGNLPTAGGVS